MRKFGSADWARITQALDTQIEQNKSQRDLTGNATMKDLMSNDIEKMRALRDEIQLELIIINKGTHETMKSELPPIEGM